MSINCSLKEKYFVDFANFGLSRDLQRMNSKTSPGCSLAAFRKIEFINGMRFLQVFKINRSTTGNN
jgi:hypothetical protein